MSKRKLDYATSIYDGHLNNPAKNRLSLTEGMYFRQFAELAMARFKWVGLPDTIDERFLELMLFQRALAVFYWDKDYDRYLALRGSGNGNPNMYDNPKSFMVIGNTDIQSKTLAANNCVPIWANAVRMPDHDVAMLFATKLGQVERTIEINLMAMRHPYVLACDDNTKQSMVNAFRQVQEGQPVIFGTQSLADIMGQAQVLDMRIDKDVVLNLQAAKAKMWNECMTFLGINNSNQDKVERLVASEVDANNSQILMARNVALNARRRAVEDINRKYNLSISVEWNTEIASILNEDGFDPSTDTATGEAN